MHLTSFRGFAEFGHERERVLHDVQNGQQGACETQKLTEVVETKVDKIPCQIHHLREREGAFTVHNVISVLPQINEERNRF